MLDRGIKQAIKRENDQQYPNRRWTMVESQQTDNAPLIYERKKENQRVTDEKRAKRKWEKEIFTGKREFENALFGRPSFVLRCYLACTATRRSWLDL